MIRNININKDATLISKETGDALDRFDPNIESEFHISLKDGSVIIVPSYKVLRQVSGAYYFDYLDDRYFINDEYQVSIIRAGYLIRDNYGKEQIKDKNEGLAIRNSIRNDIMTVAKDLDPDLDLEVAPNGTIVLTGMKSDYTFKICFNTITEIVDNNQQRKLNDMPFYPFLKGIDKFGAYYISIFAGKNDNEHDEDFGTKFEIGELFINTLMAKLRKLNSDVVYNYTPLIIKKKILYNEGV